MGSGSSEANDAAVHSVEIQVLKRDYASLLADFKEYRKEQEIKDERRDAALRSLQDMNKWVLGAATVIGMILTAVGTPVLKIIAKAVAE